ncbi:MAG: PAS domain S-box protein, partial [Desulfuromonadales bacterium]
MDRRFRILVVDDEYVNTQLIKSVLGEEYDILTALNGHEAIDLIEQYKPDLILLDVMMPDITGFEVCKIIKADERFADIPVIFLTALDSQNGQLQGLEVGGIDYLTKPINFALLKLRVRNHLAMKEQWDQLVLQKEKLDLMLAEQELQNRQMRETKADLRKSEEMYRVLFREMLDGFALHEIICDAEGNPTDYRFLAVNPAFERLTGLKAEELIGRTVLEVLPNTEQHWIDTYGKVALSGEPVFFENYTAALDKHFEVTAFRPAPDQFVCMFADITERKKAEDVAKREQAFSKSIIDSIPGTFYVLDENGRYVRWNSYQRDEIVGKSEDEIAGMNAADTIHPDDRALIGSRIANVLINGVEESVEGRVLLHGGPAYRWLLMTGQRIIIDGKPLLVGTGIDITERKLSDTYKDISREVLMTMNEQGDLKDAILKAIASLKAGTGFDAVGIRLQEGDDYPYFTEEGFPKELLLKENSLLERNIDGGICRDKDGNVCLECTCGLVITGKREPGHPFFTAGGSFWTNDSFPLLELPLDVDPRLNPRNECIHHNYASVALIPIRVEKNIVGLIQFNDHRKDRFTLNSVELLESVAGHIGAALMRKRNEDEKHILESQLHQAQKMESVGRLAGGVAHDFNNMLSVIMGHAEMGLMRLDAKHSVCANLKEISKTAERSAELTRQLLAFARKQTVSPKVLDLNETISGMLKMLQRLIGENIHLTCQVPHTNLCKVVGMVRSPM